MKLVFIYGLPATGKLTVAQELSALTGYKLFHNHLAVDLLLSVFDFGTASFIELRERIWLSVFEEACRAGLPGLIFTFAPEATVRPQFIEQTIEAVAATHGEVVFLELVCPISQLKLRLDSPSRRQFAKLNSLSLFEQLHANGAFDTPQMPPPSLSIDTSTCSPRQAAAQIAQLLTANAVD